MNDLDHRIACGVAGTMLGGLVGGGLGLGVCVFVIEGTWLFSGDTVLFGAIICGTPGMIYGEPFVDWLKENWHWFW